MTHPFPPDALIALYLRDSGGDEQELSTDQQRAALTAWLQANGYRLGQVFTDSVTGTSTAGRDDFLRMIRYFQHQPPEAGILIWRSNRFGRNVNDAQFYKADLRRRGYIIHSLTDNIPEGPAGKLYEFVLDWKDELFSIQLSEDVRRGLRDLVLKYGAVPGTPPRGFRRVPIPGLPPRRTGQPHTAHRWEPDPAFIPLIQKAFTLRAQGATLRALHAETGLYKNKNSWCTFFSNPLYKGVLRFADLSIENYCPPIVTPELWDAANAIGQARRRNYQANARRTASTYLLSGLAKCGLCGSPLNGKTIKSWRYYACSRRIIKGDCDARHIPADELDQQVEREVLEHLLSLENLLLIQTRLLTQYTAAQDTVTEQKTRLTQRLRTVEKSLSHLLADIQTNGPSTVISTQLRTLEREQHSITDRLQTLAAQAAPPPNLTRATMQEIAAALTQAITAAPIETKRSYLQAFIQTITASREPDAVRGCITYHPPF